MNTIERTNFRDRPINIDDTGKRKWIYAKQPKGKWYTRRTIFAWLVLLFLVAAPLIKINGNPLMLFDIANRKFALFGIIVWAQDTYIMAIVMSVSVVFIVLFTVIFGRFWCGWACPQTVFLEFVFRRIEYLFDGNYKHGMKEEAPSTKLFIRKLSKHISFFVTAVAITNIFLMWFIGKDGLLQLFSEPISAHWAGFLAMLAISFFYYFIYAFFREQVCTMVCPYGRLQGVLLDSKSISVIYDYKRGEPRGAKNSGDCIDCARCISVCPTGIDIKNGSQLECIACTACIDECNQVMTKIKKTGNLIRYDSVEGIETGKRSLFNARTYAYSAVLLLLFVGMVVAMSKRTPLDASLLRVSGTGFQQLDSNTVSNIFNLNLINKTSMKKNLVIKLISPSDGEIQIAGKQAEIDANGVFIAVLIIKLHEKNLKGKSTDIKIGFFEKDTILETIETNFIGPNK